MAFNNQNNSSNSTNPEYSRRSPNRKNDKYEDIFSSYTDIYSHSSYERKKQPKKRPTKSKSNNGNNQEKPVSILTQFKVTMIMLFVSGVLFSLLHITASGFHKKSDKSVNTPTVNEVSDIQVSEPLSQELSFEPDTNEPSDAGTDEENLRQSSETSDHSDIFEDSEKDHEEESSDDNQESETSYELISHRTDRDLPGCLVMDYREIYQGDLVLINKDYSCHSNGENVYPLIDTRPMELYGVTDSGVSVDKGIISNINAMFSDFYDEYGDTLVMIACGFRSFSTQLRLYNAEVLINGKESADFSVAPPGYSGHQSGLAFDLNLIVDDSDGSIIYDGKDIYSWINENCSHYGFIVRYPEGKEDITGYENEPWHFRYVGEAAAAYIESNGLTLEEYIEILHSHNEDDPLSIYANGKNYSVYFTTAKSFEPTKVNVPTDHSYTISGDNYSGFIVTVDLDSIIETEESETEDDDTNITEYTEPESTEETDDYYTNYD